jgi:flagellar hook protein FlgE
MALAFIKEAHMIDSVNPALSALSAFQKDMDVRANNIANVATNGFKKSRTTFEEATNGGVTTRIQEINTPGIPRETIQNDRIVETESSNVDLSEELTGMIPTQTAYIASLKTLKVSDEMLGSLLNILG